MVGSFNYNVNNIHDGSLMTESYNIQNQTYISAINQSAVIRFSTIVWITFFLCLHSVYVFMCIVLLTKYGLREDFILQSIVKLILTSPGVKMRFLTNFHKRNGCQPAT